MRSFPNRRLLLKNVNGSINGFMLIMSNAPRDYSSITNLNTRRCGDLIDVEFNCKMS
jgi:hypothetical protein